MSRRRGPSMGEMGLHRLHIFVPALMSVGLLFWFAEVVRDALRWRGERSRQRRSAVCGRTVADLTVGRPGTAGHEVVRLHPRASYAVWTALFVTAAVYIGIGSLLNYTRPGGYVSDIAWLLALALLLAVVFVLAAGLSAALWLRWSDPPAWLWAAAMRTRLARSDTGEAGEPSWTLTTSVVLTWVIAGMFALVVGSAPHVLRRPDEALSARMRDSEVLDTLRFLDPLGSTELSVALAVVVGVAAFRCRTLVMVFAVSIGSGLVLHHLLVSVIERPRPGVSEITGNSFPSGHVLQGAVLAGLVPLAVASISGRRKVVAPLTALLALGVVTGAVHRVHIGAHWPSDVVGAALIGLAIALTGRWVIDHQRWHSACRGCIWAPSDHEPRRRSAVHFAPTWRPTIRRVAHLTAAAAALGLVVLTVTVGVPTNPEGALFGPSVATPVQLALAGLVSIGALVSWRWEAAGAVLIALAAAGLGIFAAVEYTPVVAMGITVALVVPAVLLWLSWQHNRTWAEIVGLAAFTTVLLGSTAIAAQQVYDHFFGPTHPASTAAELPVDEVRWVWTGDLRSDGITIVAELTDPDTAAEIVVTATNGTEVRAGPFTPDERGVVRAEVEGLRPDTDHGFRLVVDGEADATRGNGSFRTPAFGADSFRVALSSCARVGSNGRVFDAIAASDPLLYLALGDIHYANIGQNSPDAFRAAYERLLTEPGQAALYRDVPVAYVWDDHDYGPNDADSTSPSRPAARQVYREIVPHAGVAPGDEPINQAFTIGRVRFVMTDGRSERTSESMLGAAQLAWLVDELTASSRTHALVVWANPVPWIVEPSEGGDNWNGYPDERRFIADAIAAADIDNLIMVSGDAHMVALDDGSNSDYSTTGGAGFPVFHAAPLDRPGSIKGGPYSDGAFDGPGQFGLLDIDDRGDTIAVTATGSNWEGEILVRRTFTFPVDLAP